MDSVDVELFEKKFDPDSVFKVVLFIANQDKCLHSFEFLDLNKKEILKAGNTLEPCTRFEFDLAKN